MDLPEWQILKVVKLGFRKTSEMSLWNQKYTSVFILDDLVTLYRSHFIVFILMLRYESNPLGFQYPNFYSRFTLLTSSFDSSTWSETEIKISWNIKSSDICQSQNINFNLQAHEGANFNHICPRREKNAREFF